MSMQAMQLVLCRGAVDRAFLASLQERPHEALRDFDLSCDEIAVLTQDSPRSLMQMAAAVESWRRGEPISAPVRQFALAG